VFAALNAGDDGSTSWVQALEMSSGAPAWTSQLLAGTTLQQLQLQDGLLLATAADAASIAAFNASSGVRLWQRRGAFCPTPSPIATVYDGRQLLLADSCASLEGLTAVDVATGEDLWRGWPAPSAAAPTGNCSGYAVDGGTVYFGCSCSIKNQLEAASSSSSRGIGVGAGAAGSSVDGLCLYAVSSHSGKLRWAQALPPGSSSSSSASFPEDAQAWGHAPVVAPHEGLVLFIAAAQVFAVSLSTGKLHWSLALPAGQALAAFSQPVVDGGAGVLLLAAQVDGGSSRSGRNGGGSSKTAMAAASLRTGRWVWTRSVNGTLQLPPAGPAAGAAPLLAYGGWLHMEACRGARCCLRALNTTSGKQGWGMCLDAVAGDDATHPRAKFAIWLVTLITVASIALLIAAACLVYIQRW
jgi:outer membrane protein assembly factor BamB